MTPFSLLQTPLDAGTSLIEASAGTGKTHAIAGIFLRLLLEPGPAGPPINVEEILVVTYTEAATEELRDRIRRLLAKAVEAFGSAAAPNPAEGDTKLIGHLLDRFAPVREAMHERLVWSLNCFDLAPIFTIHGFCQRALKDRAFESGALFDAEVLPDQTSLLREIAEDYWRRNFYQADTLRVAVAGRHELGPGHFLKLLRSCLSHPDIQIRTRTGDVPAEETAAKLEASFDALRQLWRRERAAVEGRFANAADWGNKPYNDPAETGAILLAVAALLEQNDIAARQLGAIGFFAAGAIAAKLRKRPKAPPPVHEFFDQCERFVRLEADYVTALEREFIGFARSELRRRKEKLKLLSYDDLLTRLREALRAPGGAALAARLRCKYRVALIDEFQDTDPVQCEIFNTIFAPDLVRALRLVTDSLSPSEGERAGERGPLPFVSRGTVTGQGARRAGEEAVQGCDARMASGNSLFLIGDPKQAIYGFRGADIFTYMTAAKRAQRGFTLLENWRSESGLVRAVSAFFENAREAFVFDPIAFHPVEARGDADQCPLTIEGQRPAPLQVWFCPRDGKLIAKGRAELELAHATASEITRLLGGGAKLGDRVLRPQDIAVLTMTHRQADLVQAALRALGVPSVQQTQASVFASDQAAQVLRLLSGIAAPWNEPLVRAALSTELLGCTGSDLGAMDAAAWSAWLERVRAWFELWVEQGFIAMFRRLLDGEGVRARLLALPNGERALTNVLHLAEVLHEAASREKPGLGGLIQWLATRIEDPNSTEAHQLRLERDENAVQLVTVHKSKGLQYEVVFAPFCWRASELKAPTAGKDEQEVLFHDESTGALVRDLGPDPAPAHVQLAKRERLAENIRLLYVALTRARHRCYFAWGAFRGAESSAPAWLLHRDSAGQWPVDFSELPDERLLDDLKKLVHASHDNQGVPAIALAELPEDPLADFVLRTDAEAALSCREFRGGVPRDWRVASFSGLAAGRRDEAPDHDATDASEPAATAAGQGILAFPRGSKAGTCLHRIFEELDFTQAGGKGLDDSTNRELREHGFPESEHAGAVSAAVRRTLAVPLHPARPEWNLAQVPNGDRLNELAFCLPLRNVSVSSLVEVFSRHGRPEVHGNFPEQLGRLTFSPARGFLKGFVDLVFRSDGKFWLADWKSNWLGNCSEDYGPERLRRAMNERLYILQYHLYVLAIDRWLRWRMPGYDYARDFGGVFYLFLRGIDPARPELGVFRDRPDPALVNALAATLLTNDAS